MKLSLYLSPKKIALILTVAGFFLALASMTGDLIGHYYGTDEIWPITFQFDFTEEGNFVNWYQSFTLLLCSVLLAAIASAAKRTGGPYHRHWTGLALVFLLVSIDEAAQIHEQTITPIIGQVRDYREGKKVSRAENPQPKQKRAAAAASASHQAEPPKADGESKPISRSSWMPLYLGVMAVLVLVYLRFFIALPPRIRAFFVLAAVLYIGGAVGAELLSEWIGAHWGDQHLVYQAITNASELMEMLGVAAFAYALMSYLGQRGQEFELRFREESPRL